MTSKILKKFYSWKSMSTLVVFVSCFVAIYCDDLATATWMLVLAVYLRME